MGRHGRARLMVSLSNHEADRSPYRGGQSGSFGLS